MYRIVQLCPVAQGAGLGCIDCISLLSLHELYVFIRTESACFRPFAKDVSRGSAWHSELFILFLCPQLATPMRCESLGIFRTVVTKFLLPSDVMHRIISVQRAAT